jgi:hypothetical protein
VASYNPTGGVVHAEGADRNREGENVGKMCSEIWHSVRAAVPGDSARSFQIGKTNPAQGCEMQSKVRVD